MTIRNKPRVMPRVRCRSGEEPFSCLRSRRGRRADPAGDIPTGHAAAVLRARNADDCRHGGVPGSQWLARKLQTMGHTVRIVPAKFVKPYVKSNKNDLIDAEAIAEAVSRPTMRFVEVRFTRAGRPASLAPGARSPCRPADPSHLPDAGFLPRVRIAMHQGARQVQSDLPRVLADEANDLTPAMRRLLTRLSEDVRALEARIAEVTAEIEDIAAADDTTRRLMTIPGIGPLAATGLLAAAGKATQFRKARHMAAWLG